MHGTLGFLSLSLLLEGICVKIFIINRHISKSNTTTKLRIVLTDNIHSGGSCNINYYHCMRVLGGKRIKLKTQERPLDFETMTTIRISPFGGLTG